jgi:hypothetical protein
MFEDLTQEERDEMSTLLKQTGSVDKNEALTAQRVFAAALTTPLRQGILPGDTVLELFARQTFDPNARIEYPIDFYRPDNAAEFTAYVIPNQGKIPQRQIESDYLTVPTYDIGAGIDWLLRYARETRWDIVGRALEVLEAGFVKKMNDDSWHTILAAGFDRNIVVSDANAAAGQFTKRLVSLMKLVMRRNGGGNSASLNRGRLTHLFVSPEAMEDMRNWGVDEVDEVTRREIYLADDVGASSIFGVKIVPLDELGEGQEYQTYYQQTIAVGASNNGMAAGDVELVVGLDATNNDAFVMPIREELQVFEDETLHRERRQGYYAWMSAGFAVLNNSRVLLGSL